jgi:hypothetical protein
LTSEEAKVCLEPRQNGTHVMKVGEPVPVATHTGEITIGGVALPCFVLENEQRVISQNGMLAALGMSRGSGGERLASFAGQERLKPFVANELLEGIADAVRFIPPQGGAAAYGYECTILADLCEAILAARDAGALTVQQAHIAKQAEALVRSFARLGIIALIDEATGYEDYRNRGALQQLLDQYIQAEFRPWTKTFPDAYYKQMFRLKGWPEHLWAGGRPGVVGKYTNDLVYARLAPGVLQALRLLNPVQPEGGRGRYHHQHLTEHEGYPALKQHLGQVVVLMRAAANWDNFIMLADRALPKYRENYELILVDPETGDPV